MVTWKFCDPILTSWGRRGNPLGSHSHRACAWLGGTKVSGISIPLLHKIAKSGSTQKPEIHCPSRTCWGNEWQKSWDHSSPCAIWGPNSYRSITASLLLCAAPSLTGAIMTFWHEPQHCLLWTSGTDHLRTHHQNWDKSVFRIFPRAWVIQGFASRSEGL